MIRQCIRYQKPLEQADRQAATSFFPAAILLEKLEIFEDEIQARNRVAALYSGLLEDRFGLQAVPADCTSVWAQFSIRHEQRPGMLEALKQNHIPTAIYYPKPLHCQTAFSYLGYQPEDFPVSENLSENIFSLPMHPYLKEDHIRHIGDKLGLLAYSPIKTPRRI